MPRVSCSFILSLKQELGGGNERALRLGKHRFTLCGHCQYWPTLNWLQIRSRQPKLQPQNAKSLENLFTTELTKATFASYVRMARYKLDLNLATNVLLEATYFAWIVTLLTMTARSFKQRIIKPLVETVNIWVHIPSYVVHEMVKFNFKLINNCVYADHNFDCEPG